MQLKIEMNKLEGTFENKIIEDLKTVIEPFFGRLEAFLVEVLTELNFDDDFLNHLKKSKKAKKSSA